MGGKAGGGERAAARRKEDFCERSRLALARRAFCLLLATSELKVIHWQLIKYTVHECVVLFPLFRGNKTNARVGEYYRRITTEIEIPALFATPVN